MLFINFVQRDELKEILTELFNYMKDHFSNEEDYMQEISYPYLNEHKIMHKNIIHDMSHLIQNIKTKRKTLYYNVRLAIRTYFTS